MPLKTQENLWFSDVFGGYKMGTLARNVLIRKKWLWVVLKLISNFLFIYILVFVLTASFKSVFFKNWMEKIIFKQWTWYFTNSDTFFYVFISYIYYYIYYWNQRLYLWLRGTSYKLWQSIRFCLEKLDVNLNFLWTY